MTSGSFPRAFWADLKVNRLHLGPRPSLERNRRNTEGDQGPQELPDAPRRRASEVAAGLRARHRCLPHCAFAVLSNQVTAHTAAGFDLTCVFPGKLLAQNRHSWSRWSCERPGGLSESVLAESRGDHSYSTLRGGCPASREPSVSVSYILHFWSRGIRVYYKHVLLTVLGATKISHHVKFKVTM